VEQVVHNRFFNEGSVYLNKKIKNHIITFSVKRCKEVKKLYSIIVVLLLIVALLGYNQVIKRQQIKEKEAVIKTAEKAIKSQSEFRGETIKIKILGITRYKNDWAISYQYAKTGKNVIPNIWPPIGGSKGENVKKEPNGHLKAYYVRF
jgi:hypothetical protein